MSSTVAASKAARMLASRAVHIQLRPPPRNLHESREVLRVLKDFGEITMFRSLRYDPVAPAPSTMIAIYQTPDAASRLLAAAPLQFVIEPPPPQLPVTSAASFGISQVFGKASSTSNTSEPNEAEQTDLSPKPSPTLIAPKPREFHLSADKSFANHQAHFQRQEYYWGFVRNKTFAEEDLARSVPLDGLATISVSPHQLPNRIVQNRLAAVAARKTLRQLWEEGNGEAMSSANVKITDDARAV